MAWVKSTDTFNDAPEFMKLAEIAAERGDDRLEGEIKGYAFALFSYSAVAWTDYRIPFGAAVRVIGLSRVEEALDLLVRIGILRDVSTPDERAYMLVERESFVHLVKSSDKAMEAKRKRDRNNALLVVRVLLRDGDNCRYCAGDLSWGDRKGDGGHTFDHRAPEAPTTPDNYVVCCRGCNRLRADFLVPDDELPLLDEPEIPVYGPELIERLAKWPSVTARVCREMGIPNPLKRGEVEARRGVVSPVRTASATTDDVSFSTESPEPAVSQAACDPQFPTRDDLRGGRAANERTRRARRDHAASMVEAPSVPVDSSSPEPAVSQAVCDPQAPVAESVRSVGSANEELVRVQSRRRRRRRR